MQAADAAEAPALSAAAAVVAAAARGKAPRSGAGVGGERGWTRREESARSRCPQQGSLREALSHGRSAEAACEEEEEERGPGQNAGALREAGGGARPHEPAPTAALGSRGPCPPQPVSVCGIPSAVHRMLSLPETQMWGVRSGYPGRVPQDHGERVRNRVRQRGLLL